MIRFFIQRKNAFTTGLLSSLLILSACATIMHVEDNIEKRATERWEAVLGGDLSGAYEYLSPGYRSSVSSLQYQRSVLIKQVKWNSARYIESECTENTCNVKISIDYTLYGVLRGVKSYSGTQTINESWVLIDGKWYLVPEK